MSNMTEATKVEQVDREALTDHEQMADAERQCIPCKLCGGRAKITDAGVGAGYFIECANGSAFRKSEGCLLAERRLGGWAYNVMEWWNRLHAATLTEPERTAKAVAEAVAAERERLRKPYNRLRWRYGYSDGIPGTPEYEPAPLICTLCDVIKSRCKCPDPFAIRDEGAGG